jgi:hypothetical protein
MRPMVMQLGPFAARFWHWFGFFDHCKAWSGGSDPAFAPARRFSAWFARPGRCAKLLQNAGHDPAHLSRGGWALSAFPRTQHCQTGLLAQQQHIAGTGHDPTPAFHLLWGAQVRLLAIRKSCLRKR